MGSGNTERDPTASCSFAVVFGIMFAFSGMAQANSGEQDMTLQGNRCEKCESFVADDTIAEASAHARVPLSVFLLRHLTASHEIGERPFSFYQPLAERRGRFDGEARIGFMW